MLLFLLLLACAGTDPSTERPGAPGHVEDSAVEHVDDTAPDTAPTDSGDSGEPADTASPETNAVVATEPTLADLWIGDAAYVPDTTFSPPPELRHHAESSTVTAGGRHWMYYRTFRSDGQMGIGVATSTDGDVWTAENGGAAVLAVGSPGEADDYGVYAPSVVYDGARFTMVYEAWCRDCGHAQEILWAESTDGLTWTKRGTLIPAEQSWEAGNTGTPSLTLHEGTWVVTWHGFAGVDRSGSLARGIAWGPSLTALTRRSSPILSATPGTWTDVGIGRADLRHEDGSWYMVYEGLSGSALCIGGITWTGWGMARSTDLLSWTEHPDNPVALDTDSGCGEDMPAFQVVDDRVMVVATRPDTDGVHRYALAPTDRRAIALSADGNGWWIAARRGTVYDFGAAEGVAAAGLSGDLVGIAALPDGTGAWAVDDAGVVDALGAAAHLGDLDGMTLNAPVVGIAATPSGAGYWLVAADGGVFCFGDALFYGSMGGETMNAAVVGMAVTPSGAGYWLVGADGGVFTFGDAGYHGSAADLSLAAPVVGIAGTPSGAGYRLVGADGGVFAYGDATYLGGGSGTTVGIASAAAGYVVLGADGTTWTYGGQPDLGDARTSPSTR